METTSNKLSLVDAQQQLMETSFMKRIKGDIEDLYRNRMKKDVHYMTIPGGEKPFLLKAGVDLLAQYYTLRGEFTITIDKLSDVHREYHVICNVYKMTLPSDPPIYVGQGISSASTMETNFNYRNSFVDTKTKVPARYWELFKSNKKDAAIIKEMNRLVDNGKALKNAAGEWTIHKKIKELNPDIPNTWNSVKKIACTRAFRMGVVVLLAADDFFITTEPGEIKKPIGKDAVEATYINVDEESLEINPLDLSPQQLQDPETICLCYEKMQSMNEVGLFEMEYSLDLKMFSGPDEIKIANARKLAVERLGKNGR